MSTSVPAPKAWFSLRGFGALAAALVVFTATRHGEGAWLYVTVLTVLVAGLGVVYAIAFALGRREESGPTRLRRLWPGAALLFGALVLYLASSAITEVWFFPTQWKDRADILYKPLASGLTRSLIVAVILAAIFRHALRSWRGIALAVIAGIAFALYQLYEATGFAMIYRVDSPAFVYRFWSFLHTFPRPGFYDPYWNAGVPVPFLVASGTWSVGPWLLPFLTLIPPEELYTPFLAVFFLGLLPLLAAYSVRWTGGSPRAAWIGALLALAPTQRFWVHLLHYGTAPALFAMSMTLPLAALWYKFLYRDQRPRPATLLLLLVFGFIFLAWPGSLVIAILFLVLTLAHAHRLFPKKWQWVVAGVGLLCLLLLPLALTPMRYSEIGKFTSVTATQSFLEHAKAGWNTFGHNLRSTHPLLIFAGMIGCFLLPRRSMRRFFTPLIVMLLVVSGWGEEVKKLLQTERLIIPASLVAIIPASWWLDHIIRRALAESSRNPRRAAAYRTAAAWLVAILLVATYQGGKSWNGKGLANFHVMPDNTRSLIAWIKTHVPPDGRVMFAGRAVHGYGGAKIAALPYFTGREMMAADYYGFSPKLVEFQYPPRAFRYDGPEGLFAFMTTYNITHIVTWHDDWKQVFHRTAEYYEPAHTIGRVEIFAVRREASRLLTGTGAVQAHFDRFDIELPHPQDTMVIAYNWRQEWRAEQADARVFPYDAGRGVTLIGIEPGTNLNVTLRYRR